MDKQRRDSIFFELARDFFGAPELRAGLNLVRPLNAEVESAFGVDTAALGVSLYLLDYKLMRSAVQEVLMLSANGIEKDDPRLALAFRITKELTRCRTLTCVAETATGGYENFTDGIDFQIWSPRDLYSRILTLSPSFDAQLASIASIQRQGEFEVGFQSRMAKILGAADQRLPTKPLRLAPYFEEWLGTRGRHSPVLLLGERGSGKSWQMLRFAIDAYRLHQESPWEFGPAFLIRLRDLVDLVEHASSASPVVCEYIFQHHPGLSAALGGPASLGALFGTGHAVLLVDGFDEMDVLPSDSRVRARLTSLLSLLSKRTRFVMSCRAGHFSSLSSLFDASAWSGSTIGQTFEILQISPYDERRKAAYIEAVGGEASAKIRRVLGLDSQQTSPLEHALSICSSHPGLLARLKDEIAGGTENPLALIEDAIFSNILEFNLLHGRTQEDSRVANGLLAKQYGLPAQEWVSLSVDRRAELLSDLALHMAQRQTDTVDLSNLPPRIRLEYGILEETLERDLRSQTVLELAEETRQQPIASYQTATQRGLNIERPDVGASSIVRFTLRDPDSRIRNVGESSVAGAYFLCRRILSGLLESGPYGDLPADVRLRHLGQVPLGPLGAAMLREMWHSVGRSLRALGNEVWRYVVGLARAEGFQVFSPCYRHLVANLVQIGALSPDEGTLLDPWQGEAARIVRNPTREDLGGHEMALIPPPPRSPENLSPRPFLLGVHEITNADYLRFVQSSPGKKESDCTVSGLEWTVGRITVAASGREEGRSDNHRLTNEYHLFFWLPVERSPKVRNAGTQAGRIDSIFEPPVEILNHPVTYVSWYAAAAYCDWLSSRAEFRRYYKADLFHALGWEYDESSERVDLPDSMEGYRLATRAEWVWAARAGHQDLQRPWQAYPYYLNEVMDLAVGEKPPNVVDDAAWERYARYQQIMKAVLLGAGKQAREVMFDEPNDYGVSGLMGNVREWCHDAPEIEAASAERLILGATGFLGDGTFDFDYKTPLYARNTNPDVGFRIARSLTDADVNALDARQNELKQLPLTVP